MSVVSNTRIMQAMKEGSIFIEPFNKENLSTSSYDVCLGENYYRPQIGMLGNIFNIYDPEHVKRVWGDPQVAQSVEEHHKFVKSYLLDAKFKADDKIILLAPGETILAHTEEFIGGRNNITTMMKARSSLGRSFITVCKCLHPDTLVRMSDGTERAIKDIKVGESVLNVDRHGKSRIAKVKAVTRSIKNKLYRNVLTKSGRSVTLSNDHLLKISRTDGIRIVEARQLKIGDALPVLYTYPYIKTSTLTEEEAALIGYFVSEGNWQQYRVSFAKEKSNTKQRNEIMKLVRKVFPNAPIPKTDDYQIMYNSRDFSDAFDAKFSSICQLAADKRLPSELLSASLHAVREFLRTYLSCDAHVSKKSAHVGLTSRSPGLIRDIMFIAGRVGATATKIEDRQHSSTSSNNYRCASFYGADANILGCSIPETVSRSWPVNIPNLLKTLRTKYKLQRKQLANYDTTSSKSISRAKIIDIQASLQLPELENYAGDIIWDEVVSIEDPNIAMSGFVDITLDVEEEQDSLFALADGLMVLNCAGWGDVGYINRWTMEITNVSEDYYIPLLVGERIAQIIFFDAEGCEGDYADTGNYQTTTNIEQLKSNWEPSSMLPRTKRKPKQV